MISELETTLNIISTIADVLAAVGTVAAVIVALYLARRDENVRLQVHSGFYEQFVRGPSGGHQGSSFGLFATNIGRRPASISAIDLKVGLWKPAVFLLMFPPDSYNTVLPTTLEDGEQATFLMPKKQFEGEMVKIGPEVRSRLDKRYIRIGVHARNGGSYYSRLTPPVQKRVMELINEGESALAKDSA